MTRLWLLVLPVFLLHAADWPRFRGDGGRGIAEGFALPAEFDSRSNVIWKTALPPGHSSPIIVGNRIFLTAYTGTDLWTIALDRTNGKELWRRQAPRPRREGMQQTNSPASPSPASDGTRVVVFFGDFGLLAYDLDGKELWRRPLGPFNNANGHGSSPVIIDGFVVLICDQDSSSFLVALDAATGTVRWQTPRPEVTRGYATPVVYRPAGGTTELVVPGSYVTIGYSLATGDKLWWVNGMAWQLKGTPVLDGDTLYINSWERGGDTNTPPEVPTFDELLVKFDRNDNGELTPDEVDSSLQSWFGPNDLNFNRRMERRDWDFWRLHATAQNSVLAVKLGGRGDLTKNVLWRYRKAQPDIPSPLLYSGALFLVKDGGIATTLDPKKGTVMKQERLRGALDTYWASPVGGDGKVYFVSEACTVTVVEGKPQWRVLATNRLDDDGCFATPALVDGRIYLRTHSALYAFGS